MIIYLVTNIKNSKVYVGQTKYSMEHRKNRHFRETFFRGYRNKSAFHSALKKHGFEFFKWEVIKECVSKDELDYWERFYIKEYQANGAAFGYNLTEGGEGWFGTKHSEETKDKIRNSLLGQKRSKETCVNISKALMGRVVSRERIEKLRLVNTGTKKSKEFCNMLSVSRMGSKNQFYGKKHTPETIAFIREQSRVRAKKPYIITFPNGEEQTIVGLMDFCASYLGGRTMCDKLYSVATGKLPSYKGFKCRYVKEGVAT